MCSTPDWSRWLRCLGLVKVLYSRLHLFKNIAVERVNDPSFNLRPNVTAMDLELFEAGGSAEGQEQTHVRVTASQYYELMLETCERLFDNQIEQLAFEDQMREMFGLHARRFFFLSRAFLCVLT